MARELPYIVAINEAIHVEMARDDRVLFFGQNMANTENEPFVDAFGKDRVRVTPISETAEIGMAVGAALAGYRPVVELYMAEFMLVAMDQVVNEAPRFRYMSGGQVSVPLVLKAGYGFTAGWAGQHTGTIYGMFMGVPGLKVAVPVDRRRREGPDGDGDPRRQPGRLLPPLPAHARARRGPRGRARRAVRRGRRPARRRRRHRSSRSGRWSARRSPPPRRWPARASRPRSSTRARSRRSTCRASSSRSRRPGRLVLVDQATRHGSASAVIAGEVADAGFARAEGADQAGDRARHDDRLQRAARGVRAAGRGQDRGRGQTGPRLLRGRGVGRSWPGATTSRRPPSSTARSRWTCSPRCGGSGCFEERVGQLKRADEVHGLIHLSVGQEGVAAGVCLQLRDDDAVYSGHRAHGHAIATGAPLDRTMAELMGRADGLCRGLGGSMHLVDVACGFMGATGVVGGNVPIALGSALAARRRGSGAGRGRVLRRRRGAGGPLQRVRQPRDALGAAADPRVREQRLRRVHAALRAHEGRARQRRRRAVRARARDGRRQRRRRGVGGVRPLPRGGPRRAAGRCCSSA